MATYSSCYSKGFILLSIIPLAYGFLVYPQYPEVTTEEGELSTFNYVINPWPIPYGLDPERQKYKHVEISFWNEKRSGSPVTELCRVVYENGVYNNTYSGNCSLWDERMLPYDPATPNGVYFSFDSTVWNDRGRYGLLIEYGEPDIYTQINLTVHVPPRPPNITIIPSHSDYREGDWVSLQCLVQNANPPADLEWTRGLTDVMHPHPNDYKKASGYDDFSNNTIKFQVHRSDHGQTFICSAYVDSNTREHTSTTSLNVLYEPTVILSPCVDVGSSINVVEGRTAQFTCEVSANPHYEDIHWYTKMDNATDFKELLKAFNKTTLSISKVNRTMSGNVKCTTQNSLGPGEGHCKMDVQYGPEVQIPSEVAVQEFSSVTLECQSDAKPSAHYYRWVRKDDSSFEQEGTLLNITRLSSDRAGIYMCEATNTLSPSGGAVENYRGIGEVQITAMYDPRLEEFALTKFTGHSSQPAVVVCDVDACPMVNEFKWKLNGQDIATDLYRNISSDGNHGYVSIYSVRDEDFGEYECHVKSDRVGPETIWLNLLRPGVPDPPQYCTVYNVTDYYTTLMCIPGYDGGADLYTYVEATESHGDKKTVRSSVSWTPDSDHMIVHVTDLDPNTGYTLHVYGENSHGKSGNSLNIEVMTVDGPGNPNPPPQDEGASVGMIIGITIASFLLLVVIVMVAMVILWRYGVEPSCAKAAQDKAKVPYTTVPKWEQMVKMQEGYQNQAYENDGTNRTSAVPNEYVTVPGGKIEDAGIPMTDRVTDNPALNNRTNDAYEQRRKQASLAGAGALSYSSTQHIPQEVMSQQNTGPRRTGLPQRPPTIGAEVATMSAADAWEVPRKQLRVRQKLGEGAFGEVWKGTAVDIAGQTGQVVVAVKVLRENSPNEEQIALQKELNIMKSIKPHPNVIRLLGCCSQSAPLYIILEFAANGNLQTYLRERRNDMEYSGIHSEELSAKELVMFALHVATGMEYISSLGYIHRDLAARNILVDAALTCKIGDFGLARDVINSRTYESTSQRRLPLRWMAPESLFDSIYTTKSDVWSFGVLLWEILTLGSTPYPGLSGPEIMELINTGYRMDKPQHCNRIMYELMRNCWEHQAESRPKFSNIARRLDSVVRELHSQPRSNLHIEDMQANQFRILNSAPGEKC